MTEKNLNANTPECVWHQDRNKKFPYNRRLCWYGYSSSGCQINIDIGSCDGEQE